MTKTIRIFLIILLVAILAAVRQFSEQLFYDPLTDFFKNDYLNQLLPKVAIIPLLIHVFYRYILNSFISLLIIYLIFLKKDYVIFSGWLFLTAFFLLILIYSFLISNYAPNYYLFLFYVRRFLIQPLFLLIILPAIYYQKITEN